jgi:hypothetical protein
VRISSLIAVLLLSAPAAAECGDPDGPGYRGPNGKCVGWAQLGRVCGSPPETHCTAENTNGGAAKAAEFGVRALQSKEPRQAPAR